MIDRLLRNNLGDDDYAEYSAALDALCTSLPPAMISIEQAHEMGAQGGPVSEHERQLFEAWMRGHCWAIQGDWDGTTYVHEAERNLRQVHPGAMNTRMLWAAWRDRAALERLS